MPVHTPPDGSSTQTASYSDMSSSAFYNPFFGDFTGFLAPSQDLVPSSQPTPSSRSHHQSNSRKVSNPTSPTSPSGPEYSENAIPQPVPDISELLSRLSISNPNEALLTSQTELEQRLAGILGHAGLFDADFEGLGESGEGYDDSSEFDASSTAGDSFTTPTSNNQSPLALPQVPIQQQRHLEKQKQQQQPLSQSAQPTHQAVQKSNLPGSKPRQTIGASAQHHPSGYQSMVMAQPPVKTHAMTSLGSAPTLPTNSAEGAIGFRYANSKSVPTPRVSTGSTASGSSVPPASSSVVSNPQLRVYDSQLAVLSAQLLLSPQINPYHGSVPIERLQGVLRVAYPDLYNMVVGTRRHSWKKFISAHGDLFRLIPVHVVKGDRRWRVCLLSQTNWMEGDRNEMLAMNAKEQHLIDCLLTFLRNSPQHCCRVDAFIEAYPNLSVNGKAPASSIVRLPARGDMLRFVRRHPTLFHYDPNTLSIYLQPRGLTPQPPYVVNTYSW